MAADQEAFQTLYTDMKRRWDTAITGLKELQGKLKLEYHNKSLQDNLKRIETNRATFDRPFSEGATIPNDLLPWEREIADTKTLLEKYSKYDLKSSETAAAAAAQPTENLPTSIRKLIPEISDTAISQTFKKIKDGILSKKPSSKPYTLGKLQAKTLDTKVSIFGESYDMRLLHTEKARKAHNKGTQDPTYSEYFNSADDSAGPSSTVEVEQTLFYQPRDVFDQRYLGWMEDEKAKKYLRNFFRFVFGSSQPPSRELYKEGIRLDPIDKIPCGADAGEEQKELVRDFRNALLYRLRSLREEVQALEEVSPDSNEKNQRLITIMNIVQMLNKLDAQDVPCVILSKDLLSNLEGDEKKGEGLSEDEMEIRKFLEIILRRLAATATGDAATRIAALQTKLQGFVEPKTIGEILQFFHDHDAEDTILQLTQELEKCREKLQEIEEQKAKLETQIAKDSFSLEDQKRLIESLRGNIRTYSEIRVPHLVREIREYEQLVRRLERQLEEAQQGRATGEDEVRTLREQLEAARAELDNLRRDNQELTGRIAEYADIERRNEETIRRLVRQIAEQRAVYERYIAEAERVQREEIARLQAEHQAALAELEARHAAAVRELEERLRAEFAAREQDLAEQLRAAQAQADAAAQAQADAAAQAQADAAAQAQADAAAQAAAQAQRENEEELERLRRRHAEEIARLGREHATELEQLRATHSATLDQLRGQHQSEIQRLQTELEAARRRITDLEGQLRDASTRIEKAIADKQECDEQLEKMRSEMTGLRSKLSSTAGLEFRISTLEAEIEEKEAEIASLQRQITKGTADCDERIRRAVEEARQEERRRCDEEKAALQREIQRLTEELAAEKARGGYPAPPPYHAINAEILPSDQTSLTTEQKGGLLSLWESYISKWLAGKSAVKFKRDLATTSTRLAAGPGGPVVEEEKSGQEIPMVNPVPPVSGGKSDDELLELSPEEAEQLNQLMAKFYTEAKYGPTMMRFRDPTRKAEINHGSSWATQAARVSHLREMVKKATLPRTTMEEVAVSDAARVTAFLYGLVTKSADKTIPPKVKGSQELPAVTRRREADLEARQKNTQNLLRDLFVIGYFALKQDDRKPLAILRELEGLKATFEIEEGGKKEMKIVTGEQILKLAFDSLAEARSELMATIHFTKFNAYAQLLPPRFSPPAAAPAVGGARVGKKETVTVQTTETLCSDLLVLMLKEAKTHADFDTVEFLERASEVFNELGECPLLTSFLQKLLARGLEAIEHDGWDEGYTLLQLDDHEIDSIDALQHLEHTLGKWPSRNMLASASARLGGPSLLTTFHIEPPTEYTALLGTKPYILIHPTIQQAENPKLLKLPNEVEPVELEEDDEAGLKAGGISLGELLYLYILGANDTLSSSQHKSARCPLTPLLTRAPRGRQAHLHPSLL